MENSINRYHLTQQTPMIHFQSNEEGVTLRASEVKPKLDRFLLTQLGGEKLVRGEHPGWFLTSEHSALNYKLRFEAKGDKQIGFPHKLYFGNTGVGDVEKKRKAIFYPDGVDMIIICFQNDLNKEIKKWLPYFFALNAFGTRNGKGFGCFKIDGKSLESDMLRSCCPLKLYYQVNYSRAKSSNDYMNDIWVISGMMKSGFNFTFRNPKDYYKGHIFRYYTLKNIGGDKAFIKQKVLCKAKDNNSQSEEYIHYKEFKFVRAMLGLPGGFEFRSGPNTTHRVDVESSKIGRFQSPVYYRVQGEKLLIIPQIIPPKMVNATFKLNGHEIDTPNDFDLIDFLDSFFERFNERTGISEFQSADIKNTLISDRKLMIIKM